MDKRRAIQIMTKAAGNVCGCIGFVQDRNTKLNVPNTLLKKDIRDVTAQPTYKEYAVISKHYMDDKYTQVAKLEFANGLLYNLNKVIGCDIRLPSVI